MEELQDAARKHLAWQSILDEKDRLNLTQAQVRQAESQKENADSSINARISETYQWLLVPTEGGQISHQTELRVTRLSGQDSIAIRASKRLINDESLITNYGPTLLKMEIDRVPLWKDDQDHIAVKQLTEYFASYLYLPRLKEPRVLSQAVQQGIALLTWEIESFAYADAYDEVEDTYLGLRNAQHIEISQDSSGLIVRSSRAAKQIRELVVDVPGPIPGSRPPGPIMGDSPPLPFPEGPKKLRRYHGSVQLDPIRTGQEAASVAESVIAHLAGLDGANVKVSLEIEAEMPEGAPDRVVRIVIENGNVLKFENQGFEES
jgi:hypothetical protein